MHYYYFTQIHNDLQVDLETWLDLELDLGLSRALLELLAPPRCGHHVGVVSLASAPTGDSYSRR